MNLNNGETSFSDNQRIVSANGPCGGRTAHPTCPGQYFETGNAPSPTLFPTAQGLPTFLNSDAMPPHFGYDTMDPSIPRMSMSTTDDGMAQRHSAFPSSTIAGSPQEISGMSAVRMVPQSGLLFSSSERAFVVALILMHLLSTE
jgi:hypothetical protein